MRPKRTAQVRANIPPEMKEGLRQLVLEESNVISISDYLLGMIEERLHMRAMKAMRSVKKLDIA